MNHADAVTFIGQCWARGDIDAIADRIVSAEQQPDGNEVVAQAWRDFDEWHGAVCHDMPDHLMAEWEAMSMQMQIYFYSREHSAPVPSGDVAEAKR
jgi:hypothetical protein